MVFQQIKGIIKMVTGSSWVLPPENLRAFQATVLFFSLLFVALYCRLQGPEVPAAGSCNGIFQVNKRPVLEFASIRTPLKRTASSQNKFPLIASFCSGPHPRACAVIEQQSSGFAWCVRYDRGDPEYIYNLFQRLSETKILEFLSSLSEPLYNCPDLGIEPGRSLAFFWTFT